MSLVVGLAALTATVAAASPVAAEPASVTCPLGTVVIGYGPPLTNTPKPTTVTVHRELGVCTSPTHPDITTGHMHFSATLPASNCNSILSAVTVTDTIHWNTGETSDVTLNSTSVVVGATIVTTFTGSVTSGLFAGSTVFMEQNAVSLGALLCSTTGVASQPGTVTLQITSTA